MELVTAMDFVREYWWLLLIGAIAVAVAFTLLRPRQRVRLTDSAPVRPHMAQARPPEGRGIAGEHAAAASDVTGELLGAPVRRKLDGVAETADDFCLIKGIGPKFADALHNLGFYRFEQLARLSPAEIARLDPQLGPFRGRLVRDRIIEQADYLARNDIDGFEQKFGKL
jgi:predicted flap endonuclease-1-like 5' DNA nuclease